MRDDEVAGLPEGSYVAALRRLRHVEGDLLGKRKHDRIGHNGHPRWLLRLSDPDVVKDPRIERLLAEAQKDGVHNAYLAAVRDPWYLLEHVEPPDLLVTMMSKGHLRVVRNGVGAVPSNSMYGIYLHNASQARAMCEWLNSAEGQEALLQEARHYSGGLRKLEPGDLRRVLVPSQLRSRS